MQMDKRWYIFIHKNIKEQNLKIPQHITNELKNFSIFINLLP